MERRLEYIELTAKEYAQKKGRSDSWGRWVATQAKKKGLPFPRKSGGQWRATFEEWEKAYQSLDVKPRNR